jgi:hypothetical protein
LCCGTPDSETGGGLDRFDDVIPDSVPVEVLIDEIPRLLQGTTRGAVNLLKAP